MAASNLRISQSVIAFAWLIHAVSWFLPVVKIGGRHSEIFGTIRGWVAFRVALSPIWPYEQFHTDRWYYSVLTVASAATTFLFIVVSPWLVWRGSRSVQRGCAWVASAAFIVNSHWYILFGSDREQLSIGYFLWWLSFIVLGIGLFGLSTERQNSEYAQAGF